VLTKNLAHYNRTNLVLWLALSFQAGFINSGGFLACHRFVTHTTGFATQFGTEFAMGHWLNAWGMLTVPIFFLAGAMFSGFFVDRRISKGAAPSYNLLIGTIALFLFFVGMAGSAGFFGAFGEPMNIRIDYVLLAILCTVSGIQNAAITSASGSVIRTTHLTGLTTDLGIGLVRVFSRPKQDHLRTSEVQATWIRSSLITGFIAGSTVGAFFFLNYQYWGFLFPAFISTVLLALGLRRKWLERQSA
jgi:uncharacterized membrane protein YoaK (UPF0700 family)